MADDRFLPPSDDERRALARFEDEGRAAGKTSVGLDFRTAWCPRHLAPYRERWPHGAATAMVRLLQAFAADPRTLELAGYDGEHDVDAGVLPALVAECSPLCCFITDEALDAIYAETGVVRG